MEKILSKLESINKLISECEHEAEAVKVLPFYKVFRQEEERDKDLKVIYTQMKELLSRKAAMLQSLQQAINLELVDISQKERDITLEKAQSSIYHE